MTAPVHGRPNVLYVEGGRTQNTGSSRYLQNALERQNIAVQVRGPRGVPTKVEELLSYDLIILSDVSSHFLGPLQMSAVENYVA